MLDLDPQIVEGLRGLAGRAPLDADVWPAAERYVVTRRRHRHVLAGAVVALVVVTGGVVSAGVAHDGSKPSVGSDPTPTTGLGSVLPVTGPIEGSVTIVAGTEGGLGYEPSSLSVTTGIYSVTLADGSATQHTLRFDDASTLASDLVVNASGEKDATRVFFGHPGDYVFYCVVPGHRVAGMQGVVHVTGATVTLAQAEAAAPSGNG